MNSEYFTVRIGPEEEVSSIKAVRRYSLDSLIIFYEEGACRLQDILQFKQPICLFVANELELSRMTEAIEKILLEEYG